MELKVMPERSSKKDPEDKVIGFQKDTKFWDPSF